VPGIYTLLLLLLVRVEFRDSYTSANSISSANSVPLSSTPTDVEHLENIGAKYKTRDVLTIIAFVLVFLAVVVASYVGAFTCGQKRTLDAIGRPTSVRRSTNSKAAYVCDSTTFDVDSAEHRARVGESRVAFAPLSARTPVESLASEDVNDKVA